MKRSRKVLCAALLLGAVILASSVAMTEGITLSRGCHCGSDNSNTSVTTGFRTWYASNYTGTGKFGLTDKNGVFKYVTVVASANNSGNVICYRYKRYGAGDDAYQVATDMFGPGGGFADYIECDSMLIAKSVATDTVSYKMCW